MAMRIRWSRFSSRPTISDARTLTYRARPQDLLVHVATVPGDDAHLEEGEGAR